MKWIFGGNDVVHISMILAVAAAEFALCSIILVALTAVGFWSTAAARLYGLIVLLPLSVTIAVMAARLSRVARSMRQRGSTLAAAPRRG